MSNYKRKYYMLCERVPNGVWTPEFGDFNKQVVIQERKDMKESGSFIKGTEYMILTNNGSAKAITDAVALLNETTTAKQAMKLTPNQLALMSAILGVSNSGSDHLFEGHSPTWTPDRIKRNYANRVASGMVKRELNVDNVTTDLCCSLCENEEMLKNFIEEARAWVPTLKAMSVDKIKSTWGRYAAFIDCVE